MEAPKISPYVTQVIQYRLMEQPICRVCARYNKVSPAVAILNTPTVQNWSVCEQHANVIARSMVGMAYEFTYIKPVDRLIPHESEATT